MSKCNSILGISKILSIISKNGARVHFSGVGGASMSSLFCLSRYFGIEVSGSDRCDSPLLSHLRARGADIFIGEREVLPEATSLLVYSLALEDDDSELVYAARVGIPIVSRAEYMSALAECYRERIAVSGSHGKSTVTAMLYAIFNEAGKNPTALSGASLGDGEGNFAIGGLENFIYEACEYKDSFLAFSPEIALFLNLELDHVDYFKNIEQLADSFDKAMKKCGRAIVNTDDKMLEKLAIGKENLISVGSSGGEDYTYKITEAAPSAFLVNLSRGGEVVCRFELSLLGRFNAVNAALAATVGLECGIDRAAIESALSSFRGIGRRLERIGEIWGVPLFYDYAHHPTEIRSGLEALRASFGREICVIFIPHTYSRTAALFDGFVDALSVAEHRVITEIFAAREREHTVSAEALASAAGASFAPDSASLSEALPRGCAAYIVMGAGDADWVISALYSAAREDEKNT